MHGRETEHRANLDGDEKTLPKFQERHVPNPVAAIDVSTEIIQQGAERRKADARSRAD
jgi:hypothetical protein